MYVIQRTDQKRGYVAPKLSATSYVKSRENAVHFPTREAAEVFGVCNDNEIIVPCRCPLHPQS